MTIGTIQRSVMGLDILKLQLFVLHNTDTISFHVRWIINSTYPGNTTLVLWFQEVPVGCTWGPCLYLYHPLGYQEDSRFGDRSNHWPLSHNPQGESGWCGDIDLTTYLEYVSGPVTLVLDLRIVHEFWGSSSDSSLNGHLHYPNDLDGTLNETHEYLFAQAH